MTTPDNASIAQGVHYAESSDGAGNAVCQAGIVTAHGSGGAVSITVIQGVNFYSADGCAYDNTTRSQGTWHWAATDGCGN